MSLINILSMSLPSMWYCSEKSFLVKQKINSYILMIDHVSSDDIAVWRSRFMPSIYAWLVLTGLKTASVVSVLTSSAVDYGFQHRSGQTSDYKIAICCFLAKHTALRRKRKDWLGRNQIMIRVTYLSVDSFAVS